MNRALYLSPLLACSFALLFLDAATVAWLVREDSVIEWIGALALFAAGAMYLLSARRDLRSRELRWKGLGQLGVGLLLWIGAGEELSWGQRIFHWSTPGVVASHNVQHELNLHNLDLMSGSLDAGRLFNLFAFGFGVVLPVACWLSVRLREKVAPYCPVLPLWVSAGFVANQLASKIVEPLVALSYTGEIPLVQCITEIKETNASLVFALSGIALLAGRSQPFGRAPWPTRATAPLGACLGKDWEMGKQMSAEHIAGRLWVRSTSGASRAS